METSRRQIATEVEGTIPLQLGRKPIMSNDTLDISEARKQFSQLPSRLREQRVIWVTKHNKKAFAVVDMELMEAVLETLEILEDPDALKLLQQSLADIRAGHLHDHEDIEREMLDANPSKNPMDKHGKKAARGLAN